MALYGRLLYAWLPLLVFLLRTFHGGFAQNDPTTGAMTCTCKTGYTNTGSTAKVVCKDSCTIKNGGCDPNAACSHDATTHAVKCTCKTGYTNIGSGSNVVCTDSCAVKNGGCGPNAVCLHDPKTNGVECTAIGSQSKTGSTQESSYYGQCSYIGDPHLIPFPSAYGGPQSTYWCKTSGWELLISNRFVSISVLVGPNPHYIIGYVLTFYGDSICVVNGSSKIPPLCADTTPATSVALAGGSAWAHFHKTESIVVHISKSGKNHGIYVYQSYSLIDVSVGLCLKLNCSVESTSAKPIAIIPVVCNLFIDAAKKRAIGAIDPKVITMAQTTCVNDMHTSLDATVALAGLSLILHDSAKSQLDCDDQNALFQQVHSLKQDAILIATQQANELINNTAELCNEQNQCLGTVNDINF
ncbi:unnamed protein product [Rotaria socialis]|uniref:Uncharacterized protein n=2 Tax=Rotaria socialis TaxID=392032 RepID=A0A820YQJ2_9BILA|nr:unnamed protein product [Rotaria socialis]